MHDKSQRLTMRPWRAWGKSKKSGRTACAIHLSLQARDPLSGLSDSTLAFCHNADHAKIASAIGRTK